MEFDFREVKCPACDANEARFLGWRGGEAHQNRAGVKAAIVRCARCSHQYPNPMPFPVRGLDEVYVDADSYFQGHDIDAKKQSGLSLLLQLEAKIGRKGRILDVGCGVGELLWAAKEAGWEAEGVDPSREFIEIGREKLGVEGRVSTLEEAKFPDGHFDAVVMRGIMEHLYDPFTTLNEIHRVLRNDGWLWFDAPNEDGLYMKFGNFYMKALGRDWVVTLAPTFPPYHVQGFSPRSLSILLERADFAIADLVLVGEIRPQTGVQSLRKRLELSFGRMINWVGKQTGRGMYMGVWAKKK
jgi:2-polyprenyl-3-methyl-5-hydroxy-6-metoxy-1,4-benzoquinol methylase